MTIEKRMIERIQPDVELVSAYLEALKQQFPGSSHPIETFRPSTAQPKH